ncbi:urea ABC transporter permease subunit UrtB [Verrucomicrobia bacterium LW23]|nr:urea ABC transporter permease subunit UrtB [Verrucomicrobia bacterium LW23]
MNRGAGNSIGPLHQPSFIMKLLYHNITRLLLLFLLAGTLGLHAQTPSGGNTRQLITEAILSSGDEQKKKISELINADDVALTSTILTKWRKSEVYIATDAGDKKVPYTLEEDKPIRIDNGQPLTLPQGSAVETDGALRKAIASTLNLLGIADPDPKVRQGAVAKLGGQQKAEYVPLFKARLEKETNAQVKYTLKEAIAITELADASPEIQTEALKTLGSLYSKRSGDLLKKFAGDPSVPERQAAAKSSLVKLENYLSFCETIETMFRGVNYGSVLLISALGLAITFGLMGVINMAHGELIVVGAYSVYVMEGWFTRAFGDAGLQWYFIAAIPFAFVNAALVGLLLERSVIRFLYNRPLESLLATWGVSLVLQQSFRYIFGPNNVPINSPSWLIGNFTILDISFAYNRIFVVCFAALIILLTWLLLTKTPLGLLIRAVMQNREMASCVGVRTAQVNMLTFAFGSGLAGLAGAFLAQLGNVGPNLGQAYIIDCFMTVVVGGVGNIIGTVCSAISIGVATQTLEQVLQNSVLGKITVLITIILFLQIRPGGLFPTKGRGLED